MNPLIDLSEFTLNDYLLAEECINEELSLKTQEEKEIDSLLNKLTDLSNKITPESLSSKDIAELTKLINELNRKSKKIKNNQVKIYTTVAIVSKCIKIIDKIISIISFFKSFTDDTGDIGDTNNNNIEYPEPEKDESFFKYLKRVFKSCLNKDTLKNVIKSSLKEIFSLKNLISTLLGIINDHIGIQATIRVKQEKAIDKGYEMLIKCEAKMMMEKRQAKKNNDKDTEEACDKVITFIEEFKKQREREKSKKKRVNESSLLIEEYKGNEYKVTTFKLICRDIGESLSIDADNLKMYCNTSLYIIKRIIEANDSNVEKKKESIQKKVDACKQYIEDPNRQRDKNSLQAIFSKYSGMFSNKYSSFGLKVREKFESKLEDYYMELSSIMSNYNKELISILGSNNISSELRNKIKNNNISASSISELIRIADNIDDDCKRTIDECKFFIDWAKKNLKVKEIKEGLPYLIITKLFK